MSAVENANAVVATLGYNYWLPCECGGRWWYDGDDCGAATHTADCIRAEDEPPARGGVSPSGKEQP